MTNRTLKPRANSFSKSEQNLNCYNNKDIESQAELTKLVKKKSKEFENLSEKLNVSKPKKVNSFNDKKDLTWVSFISNY